MTNITIIINNKKYVIDAYPEDIEYIQALSERLNDRMKVYNNLHHSHDYRMLFEMFRLLEELDNIKSNTNLTTESNSQVSQNNSSEVAKSSAELNNEIMKLKNQLDEISSLLYTTGAK